MQMQYLPIITSSKPEIFWFFKNSDFWAIVHSEVYTNAISSDYVCCITNHAMALGGSKRRKPKDFWRLANILSEVYANTISSDYYKFKTRKFLVFQKFWFLSHRIFGSLFKWHIFRIWLWKILPCHGYRWFQGPF